MASVIKPYMTIRPSTAPRQSRWREIHLAVRNTCRRRIHDFADIASSRTTDGKIYGIEPGNDGNN